MTRLAALITTLVIAGCAPYSEHYKPDATGDLIKQPPAPYTTLQALEKAASHHGQLDCNRVVPTPLSWHYIANEDLSSYYSYVANGRFAIAKTHMEPDGDIADYVWQGFIRDKGMLEVTKQGDFTIEEFGASPCQWLYPATEDPDTPNHGACGVPDPNRI
jgi:hypothetical protein